MMDFNKKYDQSQSKKATKGASNPVSFQEARDPFGYTRRTWLYCSSLVCPLLEILNQSDQTTYRFNQDTWWKWELPTIIRKHGHPPLCSFSALWIFPFLALSQVATGTLQIFTERLHKVSTHLGVAPNSLWCSRLNTHKKQWYLTAACEHGRLPHFHRMNKGHKNKH